MTTAAERELDLMGRAPSLSERARQLIAAVFGVKTIRAYRSVFLNADGELSEAGSRVLADMAAAAGIGKARPDARGDELQFREGRRAMLLHVMAKLDGANFKRASARLTKLQQSKRESDNE